MLAAVDKLVEAGVRSVIVSQQDRPTVAMINGEGYQARTPELDPADHRGAGDSMTAGVAAALSRGLGSEDLLRLACAAGAANVTRHGLGSADTDLIPGLTERVEVSKLAATPA